VGVIGNQEKEENQALCVSGVKRRSTGHEEERTKCNGDEHFGPSIGVRKKWKGLDYPYQLE
jgi:hypothetical protein